MIKKIFPITLVFLISCGSSYISKNISCSEFEKKINMAYSDTDKKLRKTFLKYVMNNCTYRNNNSKDVNLTTLSLHLNSGLVEKYLLNKYNVDFLRSTKFIFTISDFIQNMVLMEVGINDIKTNFDINKNKYECDEQDRNNYQGPKIEDITNHNCQIGSLEYPVDDEEKESISTVNKYPQVDTINIASSDMGVVGVDIQNTLSQLVDYKMQKLLDPNLYPGKRIFKSGLGNKPLNYVFETYNYHRDIPLRTLKNKFYLGFRAIRAAIRWSKENNGILHNINDKSVGVLKFVEKSPESNSNKKVNSHLIINEYKIYREPKVSEYQKALSQEVTPLNTYIDLLEICLVNKKENYKKFDFLNYTKIKMGDFYCCPESENIYGLDRIIFIKSIARYKWIGPIEVYNNIRYYKNNTPTNILASNVRVGILRNLSNKMIFVSDSEIEPSKLRDDTSITDKFDGSVIGKAHYMFQLTLGDTKIPPSQICAPILRIRSKKK